MLSYKNNLKIKIFLRLLTPIFITFVLNRLYSKSKYENVLTLPVTPLTTLWKFDWSNNKKINKMWGHSFWFEYKNGNSARWSFMYFKTKFISFDKNCRREISQENICFTFFYWSLEQIKYFTFLGIITFLSYSAAFWRYSYLMIMLSMFLGNK